MIAGAVVVLATFTSGTLWTMLTVLAVGTLITVGGLHLWRAREDRAIARREQDAIEAVVSRVIGGLAQFFTLLARAEVRDAAVVGGTDAPHISNVRAFPGNDPATLFRQAMIQGDVSPADYTATMHYVGHAEVMRRARDVCTRVTWEGALAACGTDDPVQASRTVVALASATGFYHPPNE